jgi:hypothetical protein
VDTSHVRPGTLAQLETAIEELAEFVEQNEPQLRDKVRLLGSGEVIVHAPPAGFSRFVPPEHRTAA